MRGPTTLAACVDLACEHPPSLSPAQLPLAVPATTLPAGSAAPRTTAPTNAPSHQTWSSGTDWESGTSRGINRKGGRLVMANTADNFPLA